MCSSSSSSSTVVSQSRLRVGCWLMSDSVSGTSRWYIPSLPRTTGIDFPPDIVHQSLEPMAAVDFWACGSPCGSLHTARTYLSKR